MAPQKPVSCQKEVKAECHAPLVNPPPVRSFRFRRALSSNQHWQPRQHPKDKAGMHFGDQPVIHAEPEVRAVIRWVGDRHRQHAHLDAPPVKPHHDLRVEIHIIADAFALHQREGWREGVNAIAAHAVRDLHRQSFDPHPDMGDPAGELPRGRDGVIVNRLPADQGMRVHLRNLDHRRQGMEVMLPVRINLQRMAETFRCGKPESRHHRPALAAICLLAIDGDAPLRIMQFGKGGLCRFRTAIVDNEYPQILFAKRRDYRLDMAVVVIARDNGGKGETHGAVSSKKPVEQVFSPS